MIRSMTGYGKARITKEQREYEVEMKSVNHRYLDITVKLPRQISYLEELIKREISKKIKRGKVDVFVSFQNDSMEGRNIKINNELAKAYIIELKKLAETENILADIQVNDIAKYPEVLTIQNSQDDEMIKKEMAEVVIKAIESLVEMRKKEGIKLAEDLNNRLDNIQEKINELDKFSTGLIEEYVVKLEERLKELLGASELDKNRLAQEVVIYADKCSIQEEITRLNSHIKQFKELLKSDEAEGKKMDFIIQEMNRKTNTIGSKSNSLEVTNSVIEMKTEIENLREQVQNIE